RGLSADAAYEDVRTYDADANEVPDAGPNEVPDEYENSRRAMSARASRETYQFFVYDIGREKQNAPGCVGEGEECAFPFRANSDPVVRQELRWIYFKLFNFDGTPDPNSYHDRPDYKYYRTNFWSAEPDPSDP